MKSNPAFMRGFFCQRYWSCCVVKTRRWQRIRSWKM